MMLEAAVGALARHNFNLAEVWVRRYFHIAKNLDESISKKIYHALQMRNQEFLLRGVEAEIERLRIEKVKVLRSRIIKRAKS